MNEDSNSPIKPSPQASKPQRKKEPPAPKPEPKSIPIKKPPLVWKETQGLLEKIEKKLSGKVVNYYVVPGFQIAQDDVKYFYSHLKKVGYQEKLFFVLVSGGGNGMAAWRIASLLSNFCGELVVVLPEIAASAATMLTLAADEIIMTPLAYLTAVDTSIFHPLNPKDERNRPVSVGLDEVKRSIEVLIKNQKSGGDKSEAYKTIFNYIHPVAFGAMERSTNLSEMICNDIMSLRRKDKLTEAQRKKIIKKLNTEYPAHTYPIPRDKAREIGLKISNSDEELDDLLWSLINTYRFMTDRIRTDLSASHIHTTEFIKVIESLNSRFVVSHTVERKLDPIIKGWSTFKDEFKWISFFEKEEKGEKKLIQSYLEF